MTHADSDLAPFRDHLRRLMLLRAVLACALAAAMGIAVLSFEVDLRWGLMAALLLLLPAANLLARVRIRHGARIRETELFLHLLLDVAVLSALLYLSGGSTNPFVSLYLLPLVIAATTLPPRHSLRFSPLSSSGRCPPPRPAG